MISKKKIYNIYQKNPKKLYEGSHYAIQGSGGFVIKDSYSVRLDPVQRIGKYDMTDAVQILFPAAKINNLLGGFNHMTCEFNRDSVMISSDDLLDLGIEEFLSVGSLDSMYIQYRDYINSFFGFSMKGSSLFTNQSQIEIGEGLFDRRMLVSLLGEKVVCPYSGEVKDALHGYIEIRGINEMLRKIQLLDIFGNRSDGDISRGFLSGDLIYVREGIEIKLDIGLSGDSGVVSLLEIALLSNGGSGISSIQLGKKFKAPLLLRLC